MEDQLIVGTDGDDILSGGEGDDALYGGLGSDVLSGGPGLDFLYGGPGADQFKVDLYQLLKGSSEVDQVFDFNVDEGDMVRLNYSVPTPERDRKPKLPRSITIGDVTVDYKGRVKVRLTNNRWINVLDIKRSDLLLEVEDQGDEIRLRFKKRF